MVDTVHAVNASIEYPPYNLVLHYGLLALISCYAPVIIVSSVLTIATMSLVKQLNRSHNYILFCIGVADLLIGLMSIPYNVLLGIPDIRTDLKRTPVVCYILKSTADLIEINILSLQSLLGLDISLKITAPILYMRYQSKTLLKCCCVLIAVINCGIEGIFFLELDSEEIYCLDNKPPPKVHKILINMISVPSLFACLIFSIYIKIKIKATHPSERLTMWLTIFSVLFNSPTFFYWFFIDDNFDFSVKELCTYITRAIRFSLYLSHGGFIYFNAPIYKKAFRYLLTTNPVHWNNLNHFLSRERYLSEHPTEKISGTISPTHTIPQLDIKTDFSNGSKKSSCDETKTDTISSKSLSVKESNTSLPSLV